MCIKQVRAVLCIQLQPLMFCVVLLSIYPKPHIKAQGVSRIVLSHVPPPPRITMTFLFFFSAEFEKEEAVILFTSSDQHTTSWRALRIKSGRVIGSEITTLTFMEGSFSDPRVHPGVKGRHSTKPSSSLQMQPAVGGHPCFCLHSHLGLEVLPAWPWDCPTGNPEWQENYSSHNSDSTPKTRKRRWWLEFHLRVKREKKNQEIKMRELRGDALSTDDLCGSISAKGSKSASMFAKEKEVCLGVGRGEGGKSSGKQTTTAVEPALPDSLGMSHGWESWAACWSRWVTPRWGAPCFCSLASKLGFCLSKVQGCACWDAGKMSISWCYFSLFLNHSGLPVTLLCILALFPIAPNSRKKEWQKGRNVKNLEEERFRFFAPMEAMFVF